MKKFNYSELLKKLEYEAKRKRAVRKASREYQRKRRKRIKRERQAEIAASRAKVMDGIRNRRKRPRYNDSKASG